MKNEPYDIDKNYDDLLNQNLEKRLGRKPLAHEVNNADTDSDLVNETLWQLICSLALRISALENNGKVNQ